MITICHMKATRQSKYSDETKLQAKHLYLTGSTPKEITNELGVNSTRTIYDWIDKGGWDELQSQFSLELQLERRIALMVNRDLKKPAELDEIDRLVGVLIKMQDANMRLREREQALTERKNGNYEPSHRANNASGNHKGKSKKARKNDVPDVDDPRWQDWINALFKYQRIHFDARNQRERWTVKSRQIGFTFEAAGEALYIARETGKDQTFLSASKAQSMVFAKYIRQLALKYFDIELTGTDKIRLPNGAELRFLGTNRNTAQGYSGDLYIDEAAWIHKFEAIYETVSAVATLSDKRITVFSTPSTQQHGFYKIWSGQWWKGNNKDRQYVDFPSVTTLRKHPQPCPDKRWRFAVTIHDAISGGNKLIDLDDIKERYSSDSFKYLFECEFIDEADGIFKLSDLKGLGVNTEKWADIVLDSIRPAGDLPVAIGYDPARTTDFARCYVLTIPQTVVEAFRVIEGFEWKGFNWQWQADQIKNLCARYNVQHIGIDCSGIGSGVAEMVKAFFPRAMLISYSQQTKTNLVLKVMDLVYTKRLQWDEQNLSIAPSFLAIKKKMTGHGSMTFAADRSELTGHADDFFAIAHAVAYEDLNVANKRPSTYRFFN